MHLHFLYLACEGSIKVCLKSLMCVDDEEWIFTISNLLLHLPHSIGNIASWMMFKLTNLSFITHTSSIKGEIPSWLFFILVFWWLQPR